MPGYGYVYCMTNLSLDNMCKVGCVVISNKTSQSRAAELSNTSLPFKYNVMYDIKVKNPIKY